MMMKIMNFVTRRLRYLLIKSTTLTRSITHTIFPSSRNANGSRMTMPSKISSFRIRGDSRTSTRHTTTKNKELDSSRETKTLRQYQWLTQLLVIYKISSRLNFLSMNNILILKTHLRTWCTMSTVKDSTRMVIHMTISMQAKIFMLRHTPRTRAM